MKGLTVQTKKCSKCGEVKPLDQFYKRKEGILGVRSDCKKCGALRGKEWQRKNPQQDKKQRKDWRDKNLDKIKNNALQWNYGISIEEYNNLLKIQENKCIICKRHKDDLTKSLCVDHDHATGRVRGLLCDDCNNALGRFKDSIENLKQAINYLQGELL